MILYCCEDLIFSTKIRSTAEAIGIATRSIEGARQLPGASDNPPEGGPSGEEPVEAVMVDLALGEPAMTLIEQARATLPEARVIAFGSHVAKDVLEQAKRCGAHTVLPRSAFTEQLPQLLKTGAGERS